MINILAGISASSAALNAERVRLDVVAQNISNANTTRCPNGLPYQRQVVVFQSILDQAQHTPGMLAQSVGVAKIQADPRPPRMVLNPGHPDANPEGMVAMPDINVHEEMADLLTASRAFEANLAVVRNARSLAMQTLSMSKH